MKKCPVCNSSKYTESKEGSSCKRCGYANKSELDVEQEGLSKFGNEIKEGGK